MIRAITTHHGRDTHDGFVALDPGPDDVAERVIAYFQRRFSSSCRTSRLARSLQVDMRSKLETRPTSESRCLVQSADVGVSYCVVLFGRTPLLLLGLCTELDPSWSMTVIRPYLVDVVLGQERDWGTLLRGAVKDMARSAITIPDDLQRVLARTNRGELEVRVPDISAAASLLYAAAHQLIYAILGTAAAVIAYQAYERGRATLASSLAVAAVVAFTALAASMRAARRGRR